MMYNPFASCETNSRAAIMPSGVHFDLGGEPDVAYIRMNDIALSLSTRRVNIGRHGFTYSVAQRACLLAEALSDEPLRACYALLHFAPLAFGNWPDPHFINAAGHGAVQSFARIWRNFAKPVHEAFELDWPVPPEISAEIARTMERLHHSELRSLVFGAERECREYELRGVRPLVPRIPPLAPDKAYARYCVAFRLNAASAVLPRTEAWKGLP